jgi:hypothetical protein
MIRASSSGDHFDCFFAGGWLSRSDEACRLMEFVGRNGGATVVAMLEGTEAAETDTGEAVERDSARLTSSSLALSRSEISTLFAVTVLVGE